MQFFGGSDISPSPAPLSTSAGYNVHIIYVFNRNGVCLLYREWNRPLHTLDPQQEHKLMFGLLFSLKSLTAKIDSIGSEKGNLGVPQLPDRGCSFHSFRSNTYKLSFMETPSGIKLKVELQNSFIELKVLSHSDALLCLSRLYILVSNPRTSDLREALKFIYNLYVEYVASYTPGTSIKCELFNTAIDEYVRSIG